MDLTYVSTYRLDSMIIDAGLFLRSPFYWAMSPADRDLYYSRIYGVQQELARRFKCDIRISLAKRVAA